MTKGNYYKRIDKEDDNNLLDKNIQGNKCLNNKILNRMELNKLLGKEESVNINNNILKDYHKLKKIDNKKEKEMII